MRVRAASSGSADGAIPGTRFMGLKKRVRTSGEASSAISVSDSVPSVTTGRSSGHGVVGSVTTSSGAASCASKRKRTGPVASRRRISLRR